MAIARKCDRCGAYYDVNRDYPVTCNGFKTVIVGVAMITRNDETTRDNDLCDTCIGKLNLFLTGVELDWKKEE